MTRFIYMADTHWGTSEMGYQMQRGYPGELSLILAALEQWLACGDGVDFVLHGGDMVDRGVDDNIAAAAELFQLSVPVYLCLGNHDLTEKRSAASWTQLAPRFFGQGETDYTIQAEDCVVHVAPNQWGPSPYLWDDQQEPDFLDGQVERLQEQLAMRPGTVHIICTHSPVLGVPRAQTGFAEPHHIPPPRFTSRFADLGKRHRQLRCVLGAHSHINMSVKMDGVHCVTASSLVETPFEFKLFEVEGERLTMRTVSLFKQVGFDVQYDFNRTFVQGRERDRAFSAAARGEAFRDPATTGAGEPARGDG